MRLAPLPLPDVTEKEWAATVVDLAKQLGWGPIYHTFDSRRSTHGFPDYVLVRERCLYLELKSERGKLSEAQKRWLRALLDAGQEVYCVRPRDLPMLARVLAARMPFPERAVEDAAWLRACLREDVS